MKILIATSTPFHLTQLARELSELDNDVTIIGYMPKWKMDKYNLGKAKYKSLFWYCPPLFLLALQHIYPNFQRKLVFKIMKFVDFLICRNLEKCDIFIGLSGVNVKSFSEIKKIYNCITICERGSAHVLLQNSLINKNALPFEYIKRELKGYDNADYISIPSIFAKKSFLDNKINKEKIFINNYGVDLDRFKNIEYEKNNSSDLKINVLFVGGWSYQKGVDLLSQALELEENLYITHIGSNGGYDFPSNKRFTTLGHIDNRDLKNYYGTFDLLILPSRQDGFGMVLLESLSCGLPIVASKNTGALDILNKLDNKEAIEIIEELEVNKLIKSIKRMKKKNLKKINIFTEKEKENFTWKAYGINYNNFLKEIIK